MKVGIVIAALAVVVVAGLGGFYVFKRMSDPLAAKLAEAKDLGLPITPQDLHITSLSDEQNGATLVDKATGMLDISESGKSDMKLITAGVSTSSTEADRQEATGALKRIKPEMDVMIAATERPHCQFAVNWTDPAHLVLPYALPVKNFVRAFCLKAEDLDGQGDTQGALNSIKVAHRISSLLADSPLIINMLIRISTDAIVERAFEHVIDRHRRDSGFLKAAKKLHDSFDQVPDYRRALKSELVYDLAVIDQVKSLKDLGPSLGKNVDPSTPITEADKNVAKLQALAATTTFFKELPKSPDDWTAASKAAKDAQSVPWPEGAKTNPVTNALLSVSSPLDWDSLIDAVIRSQSRRRLTDASLQIFLTRSKSGKLPKSLPDLGSSSIDPFSGQMFHYKPSGNGFALYGVGANRVDDGGDPKKDDCIQFD